MRAFTLVHAFTSASLFQCRSHPKVWRLFLIRQLSSALEALLDSSATEAVCEADHRAVLGQATRALRAERIPASIESTNDSNAVSSPPGQLSRKASADTMVRQEGELEQAKEGDCHDNRTDWSRMASQRG